MGTTRRKFTLEFKTEAAHRVIDTGRSVVEVASELSVDKGSLARWVRDERRRVDTVAGSTRARFGLNRYGIRRGLRLISFALCSLGVGSMSAMAWFRQLSLTTSMLQKIDRVNTGGRNHGHQ